MKKIKAGALQMVTFIVVVIALLLSSFLILIHIHKQFRIQTNHVVEMVKLTDRGVQHALSETIQIEDTTAIPLFDETYKSLIIKTSFWGIFKKVYTKAEIKQKSFSKVALVGQEKNPSNIALFLKDNNRPLVIVGQTKIEGQAYLPKRGVKSGNIAGHSYYGTKAIYGEDNEIKQFPRLNPSVVDHIKSLLESPIPDQFDVELLNLNKRKIVNSFKNNPLLASSNSAILLSEIELIGHIIIQSDTKITVDESVNLVDVILIAPEIEIRENVKGTFQAFATNNLKVSRNVVLDYPSALVLYRDYDKQDANEEHVLEIRSKTRIKGSVLYLGNTTANNYDVQLKIDNNVEIEGEVYSEQNLELRGRVYGTVYTNNFIVKEGGTTYQNHLYNGKINTNKLTKYYVGLALEEQSKDVMKWLY